MHAGAARRALLARAARREIAIQPAVRRALVVGSAALHVVLRVEVRAGVTRAPDGMHGREQAPIPELLERTERRMQSEKSVEIERCLRGPRDRPRNRNGRTKLIIRGLAMRNDDVERVGGAALE